MPRELGRASAARFVGSYIRGFVTSGETPPLSFLGLPRFAVALLMLFLRLASRIFPDLGALPHYDVRACCICSAKSDSKRRMKCR